MTINEGLMRTEAGGSPPGRLHPALAQKLICIAFIVAVEIAGNREVFVS